MKVQAEKTESGFPKKKAWSHNPSLHHLYREWARLGLISRPWSCKQGSPWVCTPSGVLNTRKPSHDGNVLTIVEVAKMDHPAAHSGLAVRGQVEVKKIYPYVNLIKMFISSKLFVWHLSRRIVRMESAEKWAAIYRKKAEPWWAGKGPMRKRH